MKNQFKFSDHLGAFSPIYSINEQGKINFFEDFENAIDSTIENIEIDKSALLSVLSKNFILGDKTIIKNIYRSPWMAIPNESTTDWVFHTLPKHHSCQDSISTISRTFFSLLCDEIMKYVGKSTSVGVLLSGGMDSRMVAGALDFLIKNNRVAIKSVTAYTWGNSDSRDVIYSKRIADRLGWNWKHYEVNPDRLWRNIIIASERGCEYSGIHLHAMPDIAEDAKDQVELILAGSYGDSVGRAEYSGKHVSNLKPINKGLRNFANLLKLKTYKKPLYQLNGEVNNYHLRFPRKSESSQNELDYQLHYMRRMLNPCMEIINEKVPVYQVFTDPKVFGFMWSLDLRLRNNDIYKHVFDYFETNLKDIPWARTGLPYNEKVGKPDNCKKKHHSYEKYLQNDLIVKIEEIVNDSKSNYVDVQQLRVLVKLVKRFQNYNFDYLESLTWIVSFLLFEKRYFKENGNGNRGNILNQAFLIINYLAIRIGRKVKSKYL